MKHDDRVDALSMALSYFTEELKRTDEEIKKEYQFRELEADLEWLDSLGHENDYDSSNQWEGVISR